jgi:hypothetical protein
MCIAELGEEALYHIPPTFVKITALSNAILSRRSSLTLLSLRSFALAFFSAAEPCFAGRLLTSHSGNQLKAYYRDH